MAKRKSTTDAAASGETTTAVTKSTGPSPAMMALFQDSAQRIAKLKLERRNLPSMIKPADIPVGQVLVGEILKVVDSPVSTVKGKLLWLKLENGQEWLLPCTGVIRSALAPGIEGTEKLQAALEKEIGKLLIVKATGTKPSKYKRDMFMFDVYTAKL